MPQNLSKEALVEALPWRFDVYHDALAPVLPEAKRFLVEVLEGRCRRWLSILGPSGIGKTFIHAQILKFAEQKWRRVVTKRHEDGSTSGRTPQIARVIPSVDLDTYTAAREYAQFDLVYVEDIGAGEFGDRGAGAVTRERLKNLLQLRTGKATLVCSNLMRDGIADQLDPRIASRLKRDGSVCIELPMEVPDFNG